MLYQVVLTGLLLSVLLLVPGALKNCAEPPKWVMVAIIVPGVLGLATAFLGTLVLIWI